MYCKRFLTFDILIGHDIIMYYITIKWLLFTLFGIYLGTTVQAILRSMVGDQTLKLSYEQNLTH